ncbi:MAG: class I SAM-dependent methyltransferase [Myxococcota bacterium]|jgi:SAM-dependent methyltransferase|nr:class I SAM-dependent methyltransferase [Myxococcota bacterium]
MQRRLEPELMLDEAQVRAYAEADFSDANQRFVQLASPQLDAVGAGRARPCAVDLGCGHGDILMHLCRRHPDWELLGVDASAPMLAWAPRHFSTKSAVWGLAEDEAAAMWQRLQWRQLRLPAPQLASSAFSAVLSNSLLHHLPSPEVFWEELYRLARRPAAIVVMDLLRPDSVAEAEQLVASVAASSSPILQSDFLASLLASFTLEELREQLARSPLGAAWSERVVQVSERHWALCGVLR